MDYPDLRYIPPGSKHAEQYLSAAKLVMTDSPKSTLPNNLVTIMLLKCNRHLWDGHIVAKVFRDQASKGKSQ
jgi:hypothetical protein